MKRYYLAIEGIDGGGKTTTIKYLQSRYNNQIDLYQRTYKPEWIKPLVNCKMFKTFHSIQVIVYLFLAHYNFWLFQKKDNGRRIVLMDRCFLSNICYFFPAALEKKPLRKMLLKIEPRIFPDMIYILDAAPEVAWKRDGRKKDLDWLKKTREFYIKAGLIKEFAIEIIPPMSEIDGPYTIISQAIEEMLC